MCVTRCAHAHCTPHRCHFHSDNSNSKLHFFVWLSFAMYFHFISVDWYFGKKEEKKFNTIKMLFIYVLE